MTIENENDSIRQRSNNYYKVIYYIIICDYIYMCYICCAFWEVDVLIVSLI